MMQKNKQNYLLTFISAAILAIMLVLGVSAADSTVTYNGLTEGFTFAPGSAFTSTDLFDNFKNVMPGDTRNETITVINKSKDSDYIKVYIQAKLHNEETGETANPMSPAVEAAEETVADMHDFLSQLKMTVKNGNETIYEASPDQLGGFAEPVYLGTVDSRSTVTLDVILEVPIDMDNEYANRVGEVDWLFLVEAFNEPTPPPIPDIPQNIIVNKVWVDNGIGRPASITVHLLKNGVGFDTVQLTEKDNWSYAWHNLDKFAKWTVEEEVPEGYVATYKTNSSGWVTTITNTRILTDELTVEKVWDDGNYAERPASVDVVLLQDGEYYDEVTLNDGNQWIHTWKDLSVNSSWSVVEKTVPEGYFVSYSFDETADKVVVTNTLLEPDTTELTVNKVWVDTGVNRPESIKVYLLKDGELADSVELNEAGGWTYTWVDLPGGFSWSAVEDAVPGYRAEYKTEGNVVTVTNYQERVPYDITVKKIWSDRGIDRPNSVEIALYNGETPVESVILGEWNNWSFTWKNLDGDGNWRVVEENVPERYTPSYEVEDGVVVITNTETLLQTGQLNWPIPVFGTLGAIILGIGVMLLRKKKES